MMPALDWLQANAAQFGRPGPGLFYWGSGALSSVLDNAPTYLGFLSALHGVAGVEHVSNLLNSHGHHLLAISIAAVFFGAAFLRAPVLRLRAFAPAALDRF